MTLDAQDRYAIEISGWNLNEQFFVEQSELVWESKAQKVTLKQPLQEGTLVFIRLSGNGVDSLQSDAMPIPYEVSRVNHLAEKRVYQVELIRMKPKPLASDVREFADASIQEVLQ